MLITDHEYTDIDWPAIARIHPRTRPATKNISICAYPNASTIGRNLSLVSMSSRSGTESATMPAPA